MHYVCKCNVIVKCKKYNLADIKQRVTFDIVKQLFF